jgi:hypothetical protein
MAVISRYHQDDKAEYDRLRKLMMRNVDEAERLMTVLEEDLNVPRLSVMSPGTLSAIQELAWLRTSQADTIAKIIGDFCD